MLLWRLSLTKDMINIHTINSICKLSSTGIVFIASNKSVNLIAKPIFDSFKLYLRVEAIVPGSLDQKASKFTLLIALSYDTSSLSPTGFISLIFRYWHNSHWKGIIKWSLFLAVKGFPLSLSNIKLKPLSSWGLTTRLFYSFGAL